MTTSIDGHYDALIVGAGMSGLAAFRTLREQGYTRVLLIEKADEVGGTWRDNTYPGCQCDVPSPLYSYTAEPNPDWSKLYAAQPEIQRYLVDVADRWAVRDHIAFRVTFLGAQWDAQHQHWMIETSAGPVTATVLVSAAGPWNEPVIPDLPGQDEFTGVAFHSARWRHDVDLRGARIAVIGTGASAVQFVPEIVSDAAHVTVFQRTPQWVLPKPNYAQPAVFRGLLRRVPIVARVQREIIYRIMEGVGLGTRHARLMSIAHAVGRWQIRRQIHDPALRRIVTPDFVFGCKRPLFANTWYPALDRPDVTVRPCGVTGFTPTGVVGSDGVEVPADVVIYGTGFAITDMPIAALIRNADGVTLGEQWGGSPSAYLGTTTAGFPNFAILLGPGLGTLASAFTVAESQLALLTSLLQTSAQHQARVFDTRAEVEADYNADRAQALEGTVYQSDCGSYFFDKTGTNSFSWPWSTDAMRARLRTADPAAYHFLTTSPSTDRTPEEIHP